MNLEFCQDFYRQCSCMAFDLFLVLNLVTLLFVWFESDGVIEWARLFRFRFLKYDEYDASKKSSMPFKTYSEFLEIRYGPDHFLIRLITCPVCFSVWCNIFLIWMFRTNISIIVLGFNIVSTWTAFHILKWITKKSNE